MLPLFSWAPSIRPGISAIVIRPASWAKLDMRKEFNMENPITHRILDDSDVRMECCERVCSNLRLRIRKGLQQTRLSRLHQIINFYCKMNWHADETLHLEIQQVQHPQSASTQIIKTCEAYTVTQLYARIYQNCSMYLRSPIRPGNFVRGTDCARRSPVPPKVLFPIPGRPLKAFR